MTSSIIHFDSINAQYVLPYNDPYNARFTFMSPIRNPKSIKLKSIELPINFYNIRSSGTLNQLIFKTNTGATYSATIPAAYYAKIDTLLSATNAQIASLIPNTTITFALSGAKINLSATSSSITSISLVDTSLSRYVLGFRNTTFTGMSTTCTVDYVLNVDNYINMYFPNVTSATTSCDGRLNCSFKIPLNAGYEVVYYSAENTSFNEVLSMANSTTYLQVVMYDRFGQSY